jgi:hypothetical protein
LNFPARTLLDGFVERLLQAGRATEIAICGGIRP